MKKIKLYTLFVICSTSSIFSQTDEKEWKKKLKELTPLQYKAQVEELEAAKSELNNKSTELSSLQEKITALEAANKEKDEKIASLQTSAHAAKATETTKSTLLSNTPPPAATSKTTSNKGVVFKVQIGAFKNKDLVKYFNNNPNFTGDVDTDGTKKYTLGAFRDYWEADNFKKYLREMGVTDAWIVAYKDGARVDIKDVLEGVVK
ncbi:MAG: Ezrin/radixin/moesin family protein [Cytophagales bacterium]